MRMCSLVLGSWCHPSCRLLPPPRPTTSSWFSEDKGFGHSLLTCHWFSFYTYSYQGGSMLSLIQCDKDEFIILDIPSRVESVVVKWVCASLVTRQDDMLQHQKVVTISDSSIHTPQHTGWLSDQSRVTCHVSRVASQHSGWWSPDDSRINPPSDKHSLAIFRLHSQMSSKQLWSSGKGKGKGWTQEGHWKVIYG